MRTELRVPLEGVGGQAVRTAIGTEVAQGRRSEASRGLTAPGDRPVPEAPDRKAARAGGVQVPVPGRSAGAGCCAGTEQLRPRQGRPGHSGS